MGETEDKENDVLHAIEHPVETAKALEHEAEKGESARTPLIALTGVTLVVAVIFVIMLAIVMTVYLLNGGS